MTRVYYFEIYNGNNPIKIWNIDLPEDKCHLLIELRRIGTPKKKCHLLPKLACTHLHSTNHKISASLGQLPKKS